MWHEFTISLGEQADYLEGSPVQKSEWKSKIMLNLKEIKRYYASFDPDNEKCVIIKFYDSNEEDLVVYETYKQVKDAMKPIMDLDNSVYANR